MNFYGWVFKLCVRFCEWQLSGKNILFFTFNRSVNNAQFFSAKYMFAMVPTKEERKNLKKENVYMYTLK